MVKKLFKHEILSYLRVILPMHLILIGIALLSRFVQLFDNDSTAYNIVFWSSVVAFIVGVVVCILLTLIFGIKRFYSNLFTHEGYLSFTLPVTSTQHIFVKNIVAVISTISSFIMIVIATCFITFGEVCVELFKAAAYIVRQFFIEFGFNAPLIILEAVVAFIITFATTYMLYYACISLGQCAKKNRVAAAVGVFFIYYFIEQIIGTIFVIVVTVFYEQLHIEQILEYLAKHPITANYLGWGVVILVSAICFAIFYAITKHVINKKLNLE
ncbi:MAG: hypothetical protein IJD68_04645 [Ruminococcus sp.]|nr:hypothetical protein [Ruminococcus sp.]